jgi:hypothetical protein
MTMDHCVEWTFCRLNQSTRRKHAPVPLCPPQIPHYLTCDLGLNPGSRSGKSATKSLRYGTAWFRLHSRRCMPFVSRSRYLSPCVGFLFAVAQGFIITSADVCVHEPVVNLPSKSWTECNDGYCSCGRKAWNQWSSVNSVRMWVCVWIGTSDTLFLAREWNLRLTEKMGNFLAFWATIGFSRTSR